MQFALKQMSLCPALHQYCIFSTSVQTSKSKQKRGVRLFKEEEKNTRKVCYIPHPTQLDFNVSKTLCIQLIQLSSLHFLEKKSNWQLRKCRTRIGFQRNGETKIPGRVAPSETQGCTLKTHGCNVLLHAPTYIGFVSNKHSQQQQQKKLEHNKTKGSPVLKESFVNLVGWKGQVY